MMRRHLPFLTAAMMLMMGAVAVGQPTPPAAPPQPAPSAPAKTAEQPAQPANAAVTAAARTEAWWKERSELINTRIAEQVKGGAVELLFIGDSITQGWENDGKPVWEKHFAKTNGANLGIGGDGTQHVLWRLENGALDSFKPPAPQPKAAVLMIGTNNSNGNDHTAEQIAAGISSIVLKLRASLPETRVMLLGIFPRGQMPDAQREKLAQVNAIIKKLDDGKQVFYFDIGEKFLAKDGTISQEVMPDFLHLSEKGYEIWAGAVEEKLGVMMPKKEEKK